MYQYMVKSSHRIIFYIFYGYISVYIKAQKQILKEDAPATTTEKKVTVDTSR